MGAPVNASSKMTKWSTYNVLSVTSLDCAHEKHRQDYGLLVVRTVAKLNESGGTSWNWGQSEVTQTPKRRMWGEGSREDRSATVLSGIPSKFRSFEFFGCSFWWVNNSITPISDNGSSRSTETYWKPRVQCVAKMTAVMNVCLSKDAADKAVAISYFNSPSLIP